MAGASIPLSNRIARLRPTAVNAILAELREIQRQGRKPVSLMRGEPDFDTPEHIKSAAITALNGGRTHYPDNRGEPALREAIAAHLLDCCKLRYDPGSEILVTSGATLGIYAALAAVLDDGDEVLLPEPIYDAYHSPINLVGAQVRPVRADLRGERFCLDVESLEAAWTAQCKCLLLNTPWNPVGTVLTRQELYDIAAFVERHNLVLISDEIYEAITYGDCDHQSPASISDAVRARTIVVNSLSKRYAMTGWRVGYCAGPRELIDAMFLVLQQSSRGPATFVQDAAAAALTGSQTCVLDMRREFSARRLQVRARLDGIDGVRVFLPEGGFFALVDVRELGLPSNEIRRRLLHDHGVVVVHGAAYGAAAEGLLRISFACGGETLAQGLDLLKQGLLALLPANRP